MTLERVLGNSKAITTVYVYPNQHQAQTSARMLSKRGLIAVDEGKTHTAYQAWNAPATFLISDGKLIYAYGPRSTTHELERLLGRFRSDVHIAASGESETTKEVSR